MCIEKRFVFTVNDMSVAAPAYDYFRRRLTSLQSSNAPDLQAQQIDAPQLHVSIRSDVSSSMELWRLNTP